MNLSLSPIKLLVAGSLVTAAAGAGLLAANQATSKPERIVGSGTQVLGEKSTQPSASSGGSAAPATKPTTNPSNNNGGGGGNDNKSFTITGQVAADLEPGSSAHVTFSVTNTTNQTISVDSLGAALDHVVAAAGRTGCTVANAGLTIDPWTGGSFPVGKGATATAPGFVQVSMDSTSNTGCQGAELWFHFTGTASK